MTYKCILESLKSFMQRSSLQTTEGGTHAWCFLYYVRQLSTLESHALMYLNCQEDLGEAQTEDLPRSQAASLVLPWSGRADAVIWTGNLN